MVPVTWGFAGVFLLGAGLIAVPALASSAVVVVPMAALALVVLVNHAS